MGNGNNLDELLKKYIDEVQQVKKDNSEIKNYYTKLDEDMASCIQKVGNTNAYMTPHLRYASAGVR